MNLDVQLAFNYPVLTFFLALIVGITLICLSSIFCQLFQSILFTLPNRILRTITMHKHGFPPDHCDADGDPKTDP